MVDHELASSCFAAFLALVLVSLQYPVSFPVEVSALSGKPCPMRTAISDVPVVLRLPDSALIRLCFSVLLEVALFALAFCHVLVVCGVAYNALVMVFCPH